MHQNDTGVFQSLPYKLLLIGIILIVSGFTDLCLAQADNSKILSFNGGKLDASIDIASSVFSGIGGRECNLAGTISSFSPQAPTALWNPAAVAWLKSGSISLDFTPHVLTDASRLIDINGEVKQSTIDGISTYRTDETIIKPTDVGLKFSQVGNTASGAFAIPINDMVFHALFYRPIDFDIQALFTGFKAKIMTSIPMSDREEEVIFNSFVEGPLTSHVGVNVVCLGLSRKIRNDMAIGLSIENYNAAFRANGVWEVNGTMLFAGKETAFNDPRDLWSNDLDQRIDAKYKGSSWGWKLGYSYRLDRDITVDAVFSWPANINTSGAMNLEMNTVPALNIDPGDDAEEEILDPAKLDLSMLTYTELVNNKDYNEMTINLPKHLRLGVAYRYNAFEGQMSYGRYFHEFSFEYGEGRIGLKLKNTLRLGIGYKYVQFGLGFITAETVLVGSEALEDANTKFTFPLVSLGTGFNFAKKYRLDITAVSVTMPILRMTLGYRF